MGRQLLRVLVSYRQAVSVEFSLRYKAMKDLCRCGHAHGMHSGGCTGEASGSLTHQHAVGYRCECHQYIPASARIEYCPITGQAVEEW